MTPKLNANTALNTNSEPQRQQVAILQVFSNVDGVAVSVDGAFRGTASVTRPIQIAVSAGQHVVQATKPGYKAWEYSRSLVANTRESISIDLIPVGPTPQEHALEYLQKADRLLTLRQYDNARAACDEGLLWNPGNQALFAKKAEIENARQEYFKALREDEERRRKFEEPPTEPKRQTTYEVFQPAAALKEKKVSPIYPAIARSAGISGRVTVEVTIDDRGNVVSVRVTQGPLALQRAAVDAAKQWKYRPARRGNHFVEDTQTIVFNFTP